MNLTLVATSALLFSLSSISAHPVMPITFEQNRGQAGPGVRFISRGASGLLLLSNNEITLRAPGKAAEFRLKLRGAMDNTLVLGAGESGGTVNYFRGSEPTDWLTSIPSFAQVIYKGVYPNIDLVVYGNNRQFEYDFIVAQGADPAKIAFQTDGHVETLADGSLNVNGFKLHRPFVYQLASNGERVPVDCHYSVGQANQIGFSLGEYDHSKSLTIDPILSYSSYLGGSNTDSILGISSDVLGNVYVAGQTASTNFPTASPLKSKEAGDNDCFIAKFDATGQHLIYSTYLGGSNYDRCNAIAVNLLGEVFVGGITYSNNFPTSNPIQSSLKGVGPNTVNGFVAHLDITGSRLIYSTYLGGGGEFLNGIALDLLSNAYVAGVTNSPNYPVTKGAYQGVCKGACLDSGYVSKISATGSLVYSTYLGGSTNYDSANGIAVDLTGSAYVAGEAHSVDFPTTKTAYQPKLGGASNAFVTKFSPDGSSLVFSTFIGGSNFDGARSIAVDLFGNTYVAGNTNSTNFPTVNPFQAQYKGTTGQPNIFVLKLNNQGSALGYSTYLGGSQYNYPFHISVDLSGNATVAGETTSTDFPTKAAIQAKFGGGNLDAVVATFNSTGSAEYSTYLGGTSDEYGYACSSDLFGGVWVGGVTYSTDFPVTKAYQAKPAGGGDAFLVHITQ